MPQMMNVFLPELSFLHSWSESSFNANEMHCAEKLNNFSSFWATADEILYSFTIMKMNDDNFLIYHHPGR